MFYVHLNDLRFCSVVHSYLYNIKGLPAIKLQTALGHEIDLKPG